jgi:hypothetical protein
VRVSRSELVVASRRPFSRRHLFIRLVSARDKLLHLGSPVGDSNFSPTLWLLAGYNAQPDIVIYALRRPRGPEGCAEVREHRLFGRDRSNLASNSANMRYLR